MPSLYQILDPVTRRDSAFYMNDGSETAFIFQMGLVWADPWNNPEYRGYTVAGTGGMENFNADLQSLDSETLMQLRAVEAANEAEQERQTVTFEGGTFTLILEENPTTGYLWSYTIETEDNLVCVEDEYKPYAASRHTAGGGGERRLVFQADGSGYPLIRLRRTGPDGIPDHITAFQLYVEEGIITAADRV
jgi:predicted secreted protein